MEVHLFGATSSPAFSSFALRKTLEDNINEFDEEVVETVKRNFTWMISSSQLVDMKDNAYCSFLMGKSRPAHIKPMTVPRLELSAAVLAVHLDKTLSLSLKYQCSNLYFGQILLQCSSTSGMSLPDSIHVPKSKGIF
ncbi:hypothetical protein ACROYT_G035224 [Oculina patagonica]